MEEKEAESKRESDLSRHGLDDARILTAYQNIGAAIFSSLDLDEVLDILAMEIINAGVFRSLLIALVDKEKEEAVVVRGLTRYHGGSDLSDEPTVDIDKLNHRYDLDSSTIIAAVARSGKIEIIDGWDDRFEDKLRSGSFEDRVSYFIPVCGERETFAVLATGSKISEKLDVTRRIEAMQPLFDKAAIAIQHARMHGALQSEIAERKESEEKYRLLFDNMQSSFAWHQMVYDENGVPVDYIFLEVNNAFEKVISVPRSRVIGRSISEIMAGVTFEYYIESAQRYYRENVYRTEPGHFATVTTDISDEKKLSEEIRKSNNLKSLGVLAGGIGP